MKIPITSADLGLNKLYEYEAVFEQLFSEKKLFDFKANLTIYFIHTLVKASLSHQ